MILLLTIDIFLGPPYGPRYSSDLPISKYEKEKEKLCILYIIGKNVCIRQFCASKLQNSLCLRKAYLPIISNVFICVYAFFEILKFYIMRFLTSSRRIASCSFFSCLWIPKHQKLILLTKILITRALSMFPGFILTLALLNVIKI